MLSETHRVSALRRVPSMLPTVVAWLSVTGLFLATDTAAAGGQAVGIRHPVLDHGIDRARAAAYEAGVTRVMAMDEEEMLAFVPDRPFCQFCYCPNCHAGYPAAALVWTIDRPEELTCRFCVTVKHRP